jgi:hypothetical protein
MTADNGRDRIRARLLAESASDWLDLWPRVTGARATLLEALDGVAPAQAAWRPPSGAGEAAWSIIEVARHVRAYSRNVLAVIEATARGETAPKDPPGTLADLDPAASLSDVRRAIVEESVRIATVHQRVPAKPNIERTVPHAFFGPLNCRGWYAFLRVHDGDHTRQIERLKQMPGFPAGDGG